MVVVVTRSQGFSTLGYIVVGFIVAWLTGNLEFNTVENFLRTLLVVALWPFVVVGVLLRYLGVELAFSPGEGIALP